MLNRRPAALLAATLSAVIGGVGAACHFPYNNLTRTLEAACYTVVDAESGYEVREYPPSETLVVRYAVSADVTTYEEALTMGTFYVLAYFTGDGNAQNKSLLGARTTPLLLRPARPASQTPWFVDMALAPGLAPLPLPKPLDGIEVVPLVPHKSAPVFLAARHEQLTSSPQPSDYEACTSKLIASLARSTSWRYNATASTSPSHAYFTGQDFIPEQPFDIECWVGVARLAASI